MLDALARTGAEVVVVKLDDSRFSPRVRAYLDSPARLRVVALREDARQGALYDVSATPIEDLSGESLLAAVEGVS